MKVDDARIPAAGAGKTLPGKRPNPGSFSKILERRRENGQANGQKRESFSAPDDASSVFVLPTVIPPGQNQAAISQPSVEMCNEAASIQTLVHEILVVAQPNGQPGVELQFSSKTLDGLHVNITQEQDCISIRFSTTSASVSDLIRRNLDQLSDALQHKGLQLAPIQVEFTSTQTNFESNSTGSRNGRNGQQNERQRQQKHQKR